MYVSAPGLGNNFSQPLSLNMELKETINRINPDQIVILQLESPVVKYNANYFSVMITKLPVCVFCVKARQHQVTIGTSNASSASLESVGQFL